MEYAIYITATGELYSTGTMVGTVPANMSVKEYPSGIPVDSIWNSATLDFEPRPPKRVIRVVDFYSRFTKVELGNVLGADLGSMVVGEAKKIRACRNYFAGINTVDLDDILIIAAMDAFVTVGFLTVVRKDEILS